MIILHPVSVTPCIPTLPSIANISASCRPQAWQHERVFLFLNFLPCTIRAGHMGRAFDVQKQTERAWGGRPDISRGEGYGDLIG